MANETFRKQAESYTTGCVSGRCPIAQEIENCQPYVTCPFNGECNQVTTEMWFNFFMEANNETSYGIRV